MVLKWKNRNRIEKKITRLSFKEVIFARENNCVTFYAFIFEDIDA